MPATKPEPCECTESENIKSIHDCIVGDLERPGLRAMMAEQQDNTADLQEITSKLSDIIIGNGKAGLDERVRTIEAARVRDDGAQKRARLRFWGLSILLLGIVFRPVGAWLGKKVGMG